MPINTTTSTSRTHESFFPKIKNNFEMDQTESATNKKSNSNNTTGTLTLQHIKLEDGVTLNIFKSTKNLKIKMLFHVPSFEIFIVKVKKC